MRIRFAHGATPLVVALGLFSRFSVAATDAQQAPAAAFQREALTRALAAARTTVDSAAIPPAESFRFGDFTIAPATSSTGPIAVANGTLHVRGHVTGDVVTYNGDVVVHQGGRVSGNATAISGRVTLDGGQVDGESRAIGGDLTAAIAAAGGAEGARRSTMRESMTLVLGWLAVLVVVGIGVLVFASGNLDAVSEVLEREFGRTLLAGIVGQIALVPALALLLVALALTVIGVLLIPFAIVAYVLAGAGLLTLGYLAIARITGRTLAGTVEANDRARRAASLRALVIGLAIMMSPWLVAALLSWSPTAALVMRTVAFAVTWVACTAGLGAAIMSRGGVRRASATAARRAISAASWQTPTPVSGVSAARRPTPATTSVQK
jgi:hypothetical protein